MTDVHEIDAASLRHALRALRYGRSLKDSSLIGLVQVTQRLGLEDLADTPQARAWALGRLLDDVVRRQLGRLRGSTPAEACAEPTDEIANLIEDYRSDDHERQAWGTLQIRYLTQDRRPFGAVPKLVNVPGRTVRRRLARGHEALAEVLRAQELAARKALPKSDAPLRERIVLDEAAPSADVVQILGEILETLRDGSRRLRISSASLAAAGGYPVSELVAYRLSRVAEWSQPRYRLDERFVRLSLLLDEGTSPGARWQRQEQRIDSLRSALESESAPAMVLLGPPGSGKSTLLRSLELEIAEEALRDGVDAGLPLTFYTTLGRYRADAPGGRVPSPLDWLAAQWHRRYPGLPPWKDVLQEGSVLLLLDGLNEMPVPGRAGRRESLLAWKDFLHQAVDGTGNRAVIACRSLDYSAPLSTPQLRVPQLRLEPLDDAQVQDFLRRYSPGRARELWSELEGGRLLEALRWPFFLQLYCESAEDGGSPLGRAALFTELVRRAIVREVESDNPIVSAAGLLSAGDLTRIASGRMRSRGYEITTAGRLVEELEGLADAMQAQGVDGEGRQACIAIEYVDALIAAGAAETLVPAGAALGILDIDARADELAFSHQLLQEYFAARRLAEDPRFDRVAVEWRAELVRPTVHEVIDTLGPSDSLALLSGTGWEETAIMAAAMARSPSTFVRGLMQKNLALAGRAAVQSELLPCLDEEVVDELRGALCRRARDEEADLRDRIACGLVLGDLGDPRFDRPEGPEGEYLMPPLVSIEGGRYPIGDDEPLEWELPGAKGRRTDHMPRHVVEIEAFQVGRYQVTNAEFACFMAAGGYDDLRWWDTRASRAWQNGELVNEGAKRNNRVWWRRIRKDPTILDRMSCTAEVRARFEAWILLDEEAFERVLNERWQPERKTMPRFFDNPRMNRPNQPVGGVSWYEARAYCAWLSAQSGLPVRLPSEVELEAATRGFEGRRIAWGNEPGALRGNLPEARIGTSTPVGVFPSGDTPEGLADLCGNGWEWTSSAHGTDPSNPEYRYPYDPGDGREEPDTDYSMYRIARGPAWMGIAQVVAWAREEYEPGMRYPANTFRVAVG